MNGAAMGISPQLGEDLKTSVRKRLLHTPGQQPRTCARKDKADESKQPSPFLGKRNANL